MFTGELRKQKALFAAFDAVALVIAFACAIAIHDPDNTELQRILAANRAEVLAGAIVVVGIWILAFRALDLYRIRAGGIRETSAVAKGCTLAAALTMLAGFLAHMDLSRLTVVVSYVLSIPAVLAGRIAARAVVRTVYANRNIKIPLVVVGFNDIGRYIFDRVCEELSYFDPMGFIENSAADSSESEYRGFPVLRGHERLAELAKSTSSLEAAIALPDASRAEHEELIRLCEEHHVRWWFVPWVFNAPPAGLKVDMMGVVPLLTLRGSNIEGLNFLIKRAFDWFFASLLLLVTSPLLLLGALAIWLEDRGPVFFRQERIGIHGRPFQFIKLRSMKNLAGDRKHREYVRKWIAQGDPAAAGCNGGEQVFKIVDDSRITRVGRILRRYRIDELPQLLNVLRGDMSLIGPRPALAYELELYKGWHRRRLDAVPGITGLWQVSGGNRLSFDDMVRLDVKYIEDWSLVSDLKILARTVPVLLRGEGL